MAENGITGKSIGSGGSMRGSASPLSGKGAPPRGSGRGDGRAETLRRSEESKENSRKKPR